MKIDIPKGQYLKKLTTTPTSVEVEFDSPKKVALLFICLNDRYWPYVAQVIKDCRKHFLSKHQVDYFVWTDYNEDNKKLQLSGLDDLVKAWKAATPDKKQEALGNFFSVFTNITRLYEHFYAPQLQQAFQQMAQLGLFFKREGMKFWFESARPQITDEDVQVIYTVARNILVLGQQDMDATLEGTTLVDTASVPWPSPTLMRYHLFLNQEEKLKEYDYVFYMDADMRVVDTIGDDILGNELVAAPHPGYAVMPLLIPPYEPNPESTAYIPRLGRVVDEGGTRRFHPFYAAGGFQGGASKPFLEAMRVMKKNIDKDFDNNYIAIWNDESHWNKYLFDHQKKGGDITFLDPSYVYPDSLIDELYVPKIWGKKYPPKIITLTKPFTLSAQGAEAIQQFTK